MVLVGPSKCPRAAVAKTSTWRCERPRPPRSFFPNGARGSSRHCVLESCAEWKRMVRSLKPFSTCRPHLLVSSSSRRNGLTTFFRTVCGAHRMVSCKMKLPYNDVALARALLAMRMAKNVILLSARKHESRVPLVLDVVAMVSPRHRCLS